MRCHITVGGEVPLDFIHAEELIDWVSCAASRHKADDLVSARPLLVFDKGAVPDNGFGKRIGLVDKNGLRRDRRPDLFDRDPIFVASDLEFGPVPVRIGAARFPGRRYHRFEPIADRGWNVLKFWPVHCARAYERHKRHRRHYSGGCNVPNSRHPCSALIINEQLPLQPFSGSLVPGRDYAPGKGG